MNFSTSSTPVTSSSQRILADINNTMFSDISDILDEYKGFLQIQSKNHMGYPYNLDINYDDLIDIKNFSINNLGDPFIESNYGVHSRCFEIAVLDWFANLWDIKREDYWGYITACGTEGNLQGIYLGRENLPNGVLYASEESHYSIFKAAKMFCIPHEKVKSNDDGTMNIDDFKSCLSRNSDKPIIVNVNIGTTLKGGVDDLDMICSIIQDSKRPFYIHCDGALAGIMVAFMNGGNKYISFQDKPIGSISVSGHKFIGSPVPCGVIITRMKHIMPLATNIDYINSRDATIMGSRNGHTPLYMWYALVRKGLEGIKKDVQLCIDHAKYLADTMTQKGIQDVLLNKWSCTVVFKEPANKELIKKWQLACSGGLCHIVVMPNITRKQMSDFIDEYMENIH